MAEPGRRPAILGSHVAPAGGRVACRRGASCSDLAVERGSPPRARAQLLGSPRLGMVSPAVGCVSVRLRAGELIPAAVQRGAEAARGAGGHRARALVSERGPDVLVVVVRWRARPACT